MFHVMVSNCFSNKHLLYFTKKLVVKPDQLIKRRGKLGLIQVNVNADQAKEWITERMGKDVKVIFFCSQCFSFFFVCRGMGWYCIIFLVGRGWCVMIIVSTGLCHWLNYLFLWIGWSCNWTVEEIYH